MKKYCKKHGGNLESGNNFLCETCSTQDINPCECGGTAKYFGEALMSSISCVSCKAFLIGVDIPNIKELWNSGERGYLK